MMVACPDGEIGRHARFRFWYREVCRFESYSGHFLRFLMPYLCVTTSLKNQNFETFFRSVASNFHDCTYLDHSLIKCWAQVTDQYYFENPLGDFIYIRFSLLDTRTKEQLEEIVSFLKKEVHCFFSEKHVKITLEIGLINPSLHYTLDIQ